MKIPQSIAIDAITAIHRRHEPIPASPISSGSSISAPTAPHILFFCRARLLLIFAVSPISELLAILFKCFLLSIQSEVLSSSISGDLTQSGTTTGLVGGSFIVSASSRTQSGISIGFVFGPLSGFVSSSFSAFSSDSSRCFSCASFAYSSSIRLRIFAVKPISELFAIFLRYFSLLVDFFPLLLEVFLLALLF